MVFGEVIPFLEALRFPGVHFLVAFFSQRVNRKAVARLQNRVAPHHAPSEVPKPFADSFKLLAEEHVAPAAVDSCLCREEFINACPSHAIEATDECELAFSDHNAGTQSFLRSNSPPPPRVETTEVD